MTLTDEMLLRYADGTLSSAEARVVETQMENDDTAVERLRFLRISGTALLSARDHDLAVAPVERSLALIRSRAGAKPASKVSPMRSRVPGGEWARPWRTAAGIALFAAGLALGMTYAPEREGAKSPAPMVAQVTAGGWIDKVVEYQSLYSRATIEPVHIYPDKLPALQTRLASALGAEMRIPDLKDAALEFRQGQQLEFKGKTIVQLIYLPVKEGKPVALCAIKKPVKDFDLRYLSQNGMGVMQWARGGVEFLLVGEYPQGVLEAAARTAMTRL